MIEQLHIMRRREKFILVMFYEGYNFQQIADTFRISRGRAHQIIEEYRKRYINSDVEEVLSKSK